MMKRSEKQAVHVAAPMNGPQQECNPETFPASDHEIFGCRFARGVIYEVHSPHLCITDCTFGHITFPGCSFKGAQLTDVRFDHCDLSNVSFDGASFCRVEFSGCKLLGTSLAETTLGHVLFENCNGRYINLSECRLRTCRFTDCDFGLASFAGCRLVLRHSNAAD